MWILQLPIPSQTNQLSSSEIDLMACLDYYFQETGLDEDYFCSSCKEKCKPKRRVYLDQEHLSQFVILQLNRFKLTKEANSAYQKDDQVVKIPTTKLNLSLYSSATQTHQDQPLYRLYAVIHHSGSMSLGHYWATVHCSDGEDLMIKNN